MSNRRGGALSARAVRPAAVRRAPRAPRSRRRSRLAGLLRFGIFLLLIFAAVWAGVRVAHAGEDPAVYDGASYVVRTGDDLWTIAAREYGCELDLRAAVYEIRRANALTTSVLQPGQRLTLPYLGE